MTIAKLRGVRTIVNCNTSNAFSLATTELIDFLKLGGSGGMLPQENFNFSISETVSGGFRDKTFSVGEKPVACTPLLL